MEAVTQPMSWKDANFIERIMFKRFRHDKKGHKMIAENNFFIKRILFGMGTKRKLSKIEKDYYNAPYPTDESRKPIVVWPKEVPFDGDPKRNYVIIRAYAEWLVKTTIPKLMLYAKPGMIIKKNHVDRIIRDYKSLEAVFVGKGTHYLQEDSPHEIGAAIKEWAQKLN